MNGTTEKNGRDGHKGLRTAGTALALGTLLLVLPGCATMFAQETVAQGGPEPEWVTHPVAPPGRTVFVGEGFDFDHLRLAHYRACADATRKAGDRRNAAGQFPGLAVHSWWKKTRGILWTRYHAWCEIIVK